MISLVLVTVMVAEVFHRVFNSELKVRTLKSVCCLMFSYERHSLAGHPSNHSKRDVMADFLEFVYLNSRPNGRHAGSYNAQFFIPKFSCIAPPRPGENYDHKVKASVVSEINRAQMERGRGTCTPTAASDWLDKYPKTVLHPSMTD